MPPTPRPAIRAGYVHPQIVEDHDRRDCEEHEGDQQADQGHRNFQRFMLVGVLRCPAHNQPENDFPEPDGNLCHHRNREQRMHHAVETGWRAGEAHDEFGRHHQHEKLAGSGDRRADDRAISGQPAVFADIARAEPLDRTKQEEDAGADDGCENQFHIMVRQPAGAVPGSNAGSTRQCPARLA